MVGSFLTFTFHKVGIDAFKVWWTFNDQFIARSLLSPRVKKIENRPTFAEVMGNEVGGRFLRNTV